MVCGFGFELFGVGVASESDCCCLFLPGVVGCGGIARNITLPPNSSENSVGLLSSLRRIPSAERSRGASAKAQFTCSTALLGVPTAGTRRVRELSRPPLGHGLKDTDTSDSRTTSNPAHINRLP